jgi:hypothetical protein
MPLFNAKAAAEKKLVNIAQCYGSPLLLAAACEDALLTHAWPPLVIISVEGNMRVDPVSRQFCIASAVSGLRYRWKRMVPDKPAGYLRRLQLLFSTQ